MVGGLIIRCFGRVEEKRIGFPCFALFLILLRPLDCKFTTVDGENCMITCVMSKRFSFLFFSLLVYVALFFSFYFLFFNLGVLVLYFLQTNTEMKSCHFDEAI